MAGIPVYFTQYETEFILTYDFDVWGKNRSMWRAALSEVQANAADAAFSRLQLGIAVAQAYFRIQVGYKRLEIAQAQVNNRAEYQELMKSRVEGHLENEQQIFNTQINLSQAKWTLSQIKSDLAVDEHQLKAYLGGDFNDSIDMVVTERSLPKVPLPKDIPLHLIAHRPDITAQLWLISSAGYQIEAAKAGFYPDFNLTALYGYQTLLLHKLFEWPSSDFNVDPAVTLPIFDGGRLVANLGTSEVDFDLAVLKYNELVLNAAQEVLDGIAVLRYAERQLQDYKNIAYQQQQSLNLTNRRIENNLNSRLDQLNSESNLLAAQNQEALAWGSTIRAILLLIKALGGGYDACYIEG